MARRGKLQATFSFTCSLALLYVSAPLLVLAAKMKFRESSIDIKLNTSSNLPRRRDSLLDRRSWRVPSYCYEASETSDSLVQLSGRASHSYRSVDWVLMRRSQVQVLVRAYLFFLIFAIFQTSANLFAILARFYAGPSRWLIIPCC